MTQITREQQDAFQAAAERVAAKLRDFHDGLPADEQLALHVALGHGAGEDVAGYAYLGFWDSGAINPLNDWCGTCRTPWNPSQPPPRFVDMR